MKAEIQVTRRATYKAEESGELAGGVGAAGGWAKVVKEM